MRLLPFFFATAAAACFLCCIRASPITPASISLSLQNPLNASSLAGISSSIGNIPVASFSISPELLNLFVSSDSTSGLFLLPEKPSNAILVKLVFALKSNSKRVVAITYLMKRLTHYDPTSEFFLKGSVETFKTLGLLHKSIKNAELYAPVLEAMTEVIEAQLNFIKIFASSLSIERISKIEAFKSIILEIFNLEGMFYLLANFIDEDLHGHLVDLIFSAVETEEEERLVWSIYKSFASPSNFIALPHEFIKLKSKEIKKKLVEDLIKILARIDLKFNSAWLSQFGILIRLRTISTSEALLVAKTISPSLRYFGTETKHFCNFIRLAFLDNLIATKSSKYVVNFSNFRPETPENLVEFYISLWNLIVNDLPLSLEDTEFYNFLGSAIKDLEMEFPGISEQFNSNFFDESEKLKSIQFIHKIAEFKFDISTVENAEKVVEFIELYFETEIKEISIKDIRFGLNLIYKKFLNIIKILNCEKFEFEIYSKLKLILSQKLKKYSEFIENFKEISELETFVDFAFSFPEISEAEIIFNFLYLKIDGNSEFLSFFFHKFSQNLQNRQNFFCIRLDRREFVKFDRFTIQTFLESIKNCPLSDRLVLFLTGAYLNDFLSQAQLFYFLENLKLKNYSNLSFDGPEILSFFASISDFSYFEFEESSETLNQRATNSQINSIKSLEILSSFNGELLDTFESGLIPWFCGRIVSFEKLKLEISETDQLVSFTNFLNYDNSIEESSSFITKIILHFLQFGASENDLKAAFEFIKKFREKLKIDLVAREKRTLAVASSFCLLIFIIRSNESIVPFEYALDVMSHYKLKCYRISVSQYIYKAYKDPNIRVKLFPSMVKLCFDHNDQGLVHDPLVFDGMSESTVDSLLDNFFRQTFGTEGVVDRLRIEAFCYWINFGLLSLAKTKEIVEKVSETRKGSVCVKLAVSLIRSVFKQEKYSSIRTLTAELIFLNIDHCKIFPRPFMMGIVGGVADLVGEPEFLLALTKPSKYADDLHAILHSEYQRRLRVNLSALNLSDGIENVMENYSHALQEICSFSLSMERKNILLNSIFMNLSRLVSYFGENDLIGENFTLTLLDHFVRISIYLASQIHSDFVGPIFMNDIDPQSIEVYFAAIVQFVRDSNVQALLTFYVLSAVKDRPESRVSILKTIPRFINWRRFIIHPDSFRFIFNFNGPADVFDEFMTAAIDAAFRFEDLFTSDAADNSRSYDQIVFIHESFFSSMTCLIKDFNLPAKYTIQALQLMNRNYDSVEIISETFVKFLRAAIKVRQISADSSCYRISSKSYGVGCVYDSQIAVVKLVHEFLEKRPDFLCLALLSKKDSESFQFMLELEIASKNLVSFDSTTINFIRSIFYWPYSGIESLKAIVHVPLPEHAIRSLISWISSSSSSSHETVLPIAFIFLDLIPSTFTIESFTDSCLSKSWYSISNLIIEWFAKLASDFPTKFGQNIEGHLIEKYFNVLLWSLEFDGKEELISYSISAFLDSLIFSSEDVKYRVIRLFSSKYFRPLLSALTSSKKANFSLSTNFRKLTEANFELAKEVEKLIPFLFENENLSVDDEILHERTLFLDNLNELEVVEEISNLKKKIFGIFVQISRLRSMGNETDLTLKFIDKLGKLAKKFYSRPPSEESVILAVSICKAINFLQKEIVLQANSKIFIDLFKFIYKHISREVKIKEYFVAIEIILSQIVCIKDIKNIFIILIDDLSLGCCLIPSNGFSNQFYKHKKLIESFISSYLIKLNKLGNEISANNEVELDGIHFITIFNILHKSNAPADIVEFWIRNVSGLNCNDIITDDFAENLKNFSSKRKEFIEDLAKVYFNKFFVRKMFALTSGKCKENLLSFFRLVFMDNSQLFERLLAEKLPIGLQVQMRQNIGDVLAERKRKIVQEFVEKCELPTNENFETSEVIGLASKLEIFLKFDLSLLPSEQFTIFFSGLDLLIEQLPQRNIIENSGQIFNLIAISCALKIKNGFTVGTDAILLVLRLNGVLKPNEEVFNLVLNQIVKLDHEFTAMDSVSVARMIERAPEPTRRLNEFLTNPKNLKSRALIIETVLENIQKSDKLEIHLVVQDLLANLIKKYKQQKDQSLEQFEDLLCLIHLARKHKLLGKTQILTLDRLN